MNTQEALEIPQQRTADEPQDFPEPAPLASHGPARIIAMVNQKGGVGKTTSSINLGAALAAYGRKMLLVDFDPQGALSVGLGLNPYELDISIYNLLMNPRLDPHEVIVETEFDNIVLTQHIFTVILVKSFLKICISYRHPNL